jgi:hypothetical protein
VNRAALLLFALATACSRAEAGGAPSDSESVPPVPHVARVCTEQEPRWPEEYPSHFLRVPEGIAITAGDTPSPDHPAGTVYVLESAPTGHLAMAEWDLATGSALRRRAIAFDPNDSRILHEGDRLHLVARGAGTYDTYYALLDGSFRVLSRSPMKKLGWTSARSLASDGTLTLVVGMVPSLDGAGGYEGYAATFDVAGKPMAERELPYDSGESRLFPDCAVVVRGTPYMLRLQGGALRLHQLTRDLVEVISTTIPIDPNVQWDQPRLWAREDHLVVDAPPVQFEVSLDLTHVRPVPRRPPRSPRYLEDRAECSKSATVGPAYALLCNPTGGATDRAPFIAWDRAQR